MEQGIAALATLTATITPAVSWPGEHGACECTGKAGKYCGDRRAQVGGAAAGKKQIIEAQRQCLILIQWITLRIAQQAGQDNLDIGIVLQIAAINDHRGAVVAHRGELSGYQIPVGKNPDGTVKEH